MSRDAPIREILNADQRDPWLPSSELRQIVHEASTDTGLLDDLADVRGAELDD